MRSARISACFVGLMLAAVLVAQEREDRTLLDHASAAGAASAGPRRGGGRGAGRGAAGPSLPTEFTAEFGMLLGQHRMALEIRDFPSGQFTPLPLADVMAVLRAREAAGTIRLTPKK